MGERSEHMLAERAPASRSALGFGGAAPGVMGERSEHMLAETREEQP